METENKIKERERTYIQHNYNRKPRDRYEGLIWISILSAITLASLSSCNIIKNDIKDRNANRDYPPTTYSTNDIRGWKL